MIDDDSDSEYEYLYKIVLLGDSGTGKSSIVNKYSDRTFDIKTKTTIGVEFKTVTSSINGHLIKLQIWDTAGQERYRAITAAYYRGAMGIVMVFDITSKKSFLGVRNWISEIVENCKTEDVCLILVGNKADLSNMREVTIEEAKKYAESIKGFCKEISYFETSALNSMNIDKIFHELASQILTKTLESEANIVVPPVENKVVEITKVQKVQTNTVKCKC